MIYYILNFLFGGDNMENKIKAIFIDYMGTIVTEKSEYAKEVMRKTYIGSSAASPEEIVGFWFKTSDNLMRKSYGDNFKTVYEISLEAFRLTDEKYHIKESLEELCRILEMNWMFSPAFDDTQGFFEKCPVPIYVLSNNDDKYITKAIKNIGVDPTGTITSEMVKSYKPRKEIFEKALEICKYQTNEVVHIGDSIRNDVLGARDVGIEAWLLDRDGKSKEKDIQTFSNLSEVLDKVIERLG